MNIVSRPILINMQRSRTGEMCGIIGCPNNHNIQYSKCLTSHSSRSKDCQNQST
jgi:hypothetical protein